MTGWNQHLFVTGIFLCLFPTQTRLFQKFPGNGKLFFRNIQECQLFPARNTNAFQTISLKDAAFFVSSADPYFFLYYSTNPIHPIPCALCNPKPAPNATSSTSAEALTSKRNFV